MTNALRWTDRCDGLTSHPATSITSDTHVVIAHVTSATSITSIITNHRTRQYLQRAQPPPPQIWKGTKLLQNMSSVSFGCWVRKFVECVGPHLLAHQDFTSITFIRAPLPHPPHPSHLLQQNPSHWSHALRYVDHIHYIRVPTA
jgi:hypothetical protein